MLLQPEPPYKRFRGIFPSWDNSARRKRGPLAIINSTPAKYAFWLGQLLRQAQRTPNAEERLIFVNAWNEWGEGCHLEPDREHGLGYLEATRDALALGRLYYAEEVPDREVVERALAASSSTSALLLQAYDRLGRLAGELADVYGSRTWKATEPLRRLAAFTFGTHKDGKH